METAVRVRGSGNQLAKPAATAGRWALTFGRPRPWHVVLFPVIPILNLLSQNLEFLTLHAVVRPVIVAVGATLVGCALGTMVFRDLRRVALAASVVSFAYLSQSDLAEAANLLSIPPSVLVGPFEPLLIAGCVLLIRRRLELWTTFVNAFAVVTAVLVSWPIVTNVVQRWQSPTNVYSPISVTLQKNQRPPDIYVLILDGYGRTDILRQHFDIHNSLPTYLRAVAFTVAERATANYAQTTQSLSSLLNVEYLPALLDRQPATLPVRQRFADYIAYNRVFRTLSEAGYRIRAYESEYGLVRPSEVDERPGPWLPVSDFDLGLYAQSIGPRLSRLSGRPAGVPMHALHRNHILWTLDELEHQHPAIDDPPTLVFAHLLIPHPPFVFEPDGSLLRSGMPGALSEGDHWRSHAERLELDERYEEGYAKAIRFLDSRLKTIIAGIVARADGRDSVVYIQGDHGPGSRLYWDEPGRTDMRERLSILLALRTTASPQTPLYASITPINAMRILLNTAIGTELPLLEDRSYFSPWSRPAEFIDVTNLVK